MEHTPVPITGELPLALDTVARGAAKELFEQELIKVLRNIRDEQTLPDAKRQIKLEFNFYPDRERYAMQIDIVAESKLAKPVGATSTAFVGVRASGQVVAVESHPQQPRLSTSGHLAETEGKR